MADEGGKLLPRQHRQAEQSRGVGREVPRGCHIVIVEYAAVIERGKRRRHRRRKGVVQHRDIAASRGSVAERPNLPFELFVDCEGEYLRFVAEAAQQLTRLPGAVSNRVASM